MNQTTERPPASFYASDHVELEVTIDDMVGHLSALDDKHLRPIITKLLQALDDQEPQTADSGARDIAGWPSLLRDAFLAELKREVVIAGGVWP
jgi:hypothetical protein